MKPLIIVEDEPFLTRKLIDKYAKGAIIIWGEGRALMPHINVYFALEGDARPNHVYVLDKLDKRRKAVKQCDLQYSTRLTSVGRHGEGIIQCKATRNKLFLECDRYLGIYYARLEQLSLCEGATFPKLGENLMRDVVEDILIGKFDFLFDSNIFGLLYYARRTAQGILKILHGNTECASQWQVRQAQRYKSRQKYITKVLSATFKVEGMLKAGMLDNGNALRYMELWCKHG